MRPIIAWMGVLSLLAVFGCAEPKPSAPTPPVPQPEPEIPSVEEVLGLLGALQDDVIPSKRAPQAWRTLEQMGDRAFPALEVILGDSTMHHHTVNCGFWVLGKMQTDRRRFIKVTLQRVVDPNPSIRSSALLFLCKIGRPDDTAPVLAALSHEHEAVVYQAAKTLEAIGGPRDVIAMDEWLKTGTAHRETEELLNHVKECRDSLEKRLKENPIPKDLKD